MIDGLALLVPVLLPLVAAALLASRSWRPVVVAATPWMALPAVLLALGTSDVAVDLPWLMLESRLQLDATGRIFLFFTAALWLIAGQYARGYFAADPARHRFYAFFLVTMAGNLGAVVSADMIAFYAFFALMSLASYGLVIHDRTRESLLAGRIYIAFVVGGEVLLFVGIVAIAGVAGSTAFQDVHRVMPASATSQALFGLVLLGFAIKTAAVPVHVWLPLAYRAAPTPGSAVLSGPLIKAGLLGWLRFLPLGTATFDTLGTLTIVAGLISAFWGVAVGLTQRDPKAALGYSSISQMGIMMTAVGAALVAPDLWPGVLPAIVLYAFHHASSKSALFLGAGLTGADGIRPALALAGLIVSAAALAGAPLTSGGVAKVALKRSLAVESMIPAALDGLLSVAAVGTTLLMIRFLILVRRSPPAAAPAFPRGPLVAWLTLVVASQVSIWMLPRTAFPDAAMASLSPNYLWATTWPVAAGTGIAWLASAWPGGASALARLSVRPGDILWLFTTAIAAVRTPAIASRTSRDRFARKIAIRTRRARRVALQRVRGGEQLVEQWPLVVTFVMLVVTIWVTVLAR